jgi:hypothetical protein
VLSNVVFTSVPGWVPSLLLRLAAEARGDMIAGFSRQDLADRAGIARERMPHTLDEFAHMGAVELHRMTVILRDREMLEALAAR